MAILLGRDCSLTVNGQPVAGVRSVTASESTQEIEVRPFGSRQVFTYTTGYAVEIAIETIESSTAVDAVGFLQAGTELAVVGTGFSFVGVVTSVTDNQPLDDVRSFTITIRKTYPGLRA